MAKQILIVGDKSITAAGRVWTKGTPVTADLLCINEKHFQTLVDNETIIPEPVKEDPKPKLTAGERLAKIGETIAGLFNEDGKPKNPHDFIGSGEPSVEVLELALKDTAGFEDGITSDERTEAYGNYLKIVKNGSE